MHINVKLESTEIFEITYFLIYLLIHKCQKKKKKKKKSNQPDPGQSTQKCRPYCLPFTTNQHFS